MSNFCSFEDDSGSVCGQKMTRQEKRDDGMCSRCAELLWANFSQPLLTNTPTKSVLFNQKDKV